MSSQKSILTFNVSCTNRPYINNLEYPVQIMPMARGYVKDSIAGIYSKHEPRQLLVHASYPTLVFNARAFEPDNKIEESLKAYFKLCDKIGASHFLVHGPHSSAEYENFELGLKLLKDLHTESKAAVKICVEMPAFTKEFMKSNEETKEFKFFEDYFNAIVSYDFEIVIDTAHLWSNGLDTVHMIRLLKNYEDNYTWIHFNGNCRDQFTSDKHTPMFAEDNKIDDVEKLSEECAKLGKICVCEIVYKHQKSWKDFAEKYSFELVPDSVFANL